MRNQVIHVLLVEDDEIDREAVTRVFRKHKMSNPLICVTNGREALQTLRGENGYCPLPRPYIIITDINMPQMNGLELLRELRADPLLKRSVVFVLTSSEYEEDILAAYNFQVAGYFAKSTLGGELLQVIQLLNLYQASIHLPVDNYADEVYALFHPSNALAYSLGPSHAHQSSAKNNLCEAICLSQAIRQGK